ncbi:hypothetical protein [Bacillus gaemokensis]|uniref:hypothetical protein n=1 Tax=Bacillus gaemokensis TaxID=574375 RepID=UPI000AF78B7E|nr:hypothetical protein [Bacillus gaemokensis]
MVNKDQKIMYLIKNGVYKFNNYQLWELSEKQLEKLIMTKIDRFDDVSRENEAHKTN